MACVVLLVAASVLLMAVLEYGNRRDNRWFYGDDDDA